MLVGTSPQDDSVPPFWRNRIRRPDCYSCLCAKSNQPGVPGIQVRGPGPGAGDGPLSGWGLVFRLGHAPSEDGQEAVQAKRAGNYWHVPASHIPVPQSTGVPQVPSSPHVWTPLPEHCVLPGEQSVHAPETHARFVHATAVPHVPVELQVWTPVLSEEHRLLLGKQSVHAPETHARLVHATAVPHDPVELQERKSVV